MEKGKIKALNFDLDTNVMKSLGVYPDGYRQLGKALHEAGFLHRQGSGYVSKGKLLNDDVNDIVESLTVKNPWLVKCVNKLDVTDVGKQHDLTKVVLAALPSKAGVKLKEKDDNSLVQQYKQTSAYKSNVEKFGQKTADKMLAESIKNLTAQEKKGRWTSPKKQTIKAPQGKTEKNNSGKGK